jgi:uncharacterized protein YabE (DUF348 family)
MKSILRKSTTPHGILIAAACFFILFFGLFITTQTNAESPRLSAGQRLITLHDNGQDRGLLTHATTLRAALKEAKIHIDPNDRVEPGLDESLVANNYDANIYRARPVTIVDGAVRTRVMSPYQTAKQVVAHAGITLHDEDLTTTHATTNTVSQGAGVELNITRATPFSLVLYGKKIAAYTQAKTVTDMLKSKNIKLAKDDTLSVMQAAPITAGMTIELWRNGVQTLSEDQDVAFDTEQIKDADQPVGYKKVQTPGVAGKKTVTYEINMQNGKEVSRREIQSVVVTQPIKQVEVIGAKMTNTFSGDFAGALARLRSCEGGYTSNTGNGYYGAYQYDIGTWGGYDGYQNASQAPPAVQDEKAWLTYQARGWQPWPSCSRSQGLQDIYR